MIIYPNRRKAKRDATSDDVIVKVDGGYMLMHPEQYRIWKNQK